MIRRITPADCDAIAALEARLFATALDQARLMALQANPVFCGFVDLVPIKISHNPYRPMI
jgi:hypothetical protein